MNPKEELGRLLQAGVRENEPMALHTSWQVGAADYYLYLPTRLSCRRSSATARGKACRFLFSVTEPIFPEMAASGARAQIGAPSIISIAKGSCCVGAGVSLTSWREERRRRLQGCGFGAGIPGSLGRPGDECWGFWQLHRQPGGGAWLVCSLTGERSHRDLKS